MRCRPAIAISTFLSLLALTATAGAAAPAPCDGLIYTDPAGDQIDDPLGDGEGFGPGPENTDITGVFVNHAPGADGKPVTTANIRIANLSQDVPDDATGGLYYYFSYEFGETTNFVNARLTTEGIEYTYGHVGPIPGPPLPGLVTGYTVDGNTTGEFVEGPGGVVSVVIPEAVGGKAGDTLLATGAAVDLVQYDDETGWQSHADQAPDDSDGTKDYTVKACATAPAPTGGGTTVPTTPNPGSTTPAPAPVPTTTAPAGGGTTTSLSALPLRVSATIGSAKKARKKALAFKVFADKAISGLTLKLVNSKGKTFGTAKVSSLKAGSSKLKLRARKLKKGAYQLLATGTVDGQALTATLRVKVKS